VSGLQFKSVLRGTGILSTCICAMLLTLSVLVFAPVPASALETPKCSVESTSTDWAGSVRSALETSYGVGALLDDPTLLSVMGNFENSGSYTGFPLTLGSGILLASPNGLSGYPDEINWQFREESANQGIRIYNTPDEPESTEPVWDWYFVPLNTPGSDVVNGSVQHFTVPPSDSNLFALITTCTYGVTGFRAYPEENTAYTLFPPFTGDFAAATAETVPDPDPDPEPEPGLPTELTERDQKFIAIVIAIVTAGFCISLFRWRPQ